MGAVLVRSSPSTMTRSAASMSRRVGARRGAFAQQLGGALDQGVLAVGQAQEEALVADQALEGEVGFERGARRADADRARPRDARPRPHGHATLAEGRLEPRAQAAHELAGRQARQADDRPADALGAVDRLVAVAAAVAEEVAVDLAVVAVAARGAARRSARRRWCCSRAPQCGAHGRAPSAGPTCACSGRRRSCREDAGRADLDQVAAELALEGAVAQRARSRPRCAGRRRRSRGRRRSRRRSAGSGSTGCSGSSRGSRTGPGPGCRRCACGSGSGGRRGRS